MIARGLILAFAALPAAGQAEVKSATPAGFELENKAVVGAPPAEVYAALVAVGEWWNGDHTYSGDASRLSIEARPGGCFCESLPEGGGVEHMRVVHAWPGVLLRLSGALGPLQAEGAVGSLSWSLKRSGSGTEIVQTYVVGGMIRMGADKVAPFVDKVMAEQLARLTARLKGRIRD